MWLTRQGSRSLGLPLETLKRSQPTCCCSKTPTCRVYSGVATLVSRINKNRQVHRFITTDLVPSRSCSPQPRNLRVKNLSGKSSSTCCPKRGCRPSYTTSNTTVLKRLQVVWMIWRNDAPGARPLSSYEMMLLPPSCRGTIHFVQAPCKTRIWRLDVTAASRPACKKR